MFSAMLGVPMVYTCGIFHEMPKFASDAYKGDYAKSAVGLCCNSVCSSVLCA